MWVFPISHSRYADNFCGLKLITLSRYRDSFSNRVLAPEGELLSFAPPRQLLHALLYLLHPCSRKESSQRKGGPIAAHVLRSSHLCPVGYLSGDGRMGFLPFMPFG